ncbi:hypothetical protein GCM10011506_00130 [Marivirga lumbricoides]|uniref:PepSY domain-containing protein n=1 Tax=Marivirga lumbricoides TaxID=1046115 RepID=A0ABQ1L4C9_9BACT|nr:hypothetical protein GCM10011506_00130 [Marivirga lumbricoides]
MKKLILTLGLVTSIGMVSMAQSIQPTNTAATEEVKAVQIESNQVDSKKIKFEEAPAAVQETFNNSQYTKESIKEVHMMEENSLKVYKIIIEVDNQKWALKYDANGKLIDKKEVM